MEQVELGSGFKVLGVAGRESNSASPCSETVTDGRLLGAGLLSMLVVELLVDVHVDSSTHFFPADVATRSSSLCCPA